MVRKRIVVAGLFAIGTIATAAARRRLTPELDEEMEYRLRQYQFHGS